MAMVTEGFLTPKCMVLARTSSNLTYPPAYLFLQGGKETEEAIHVGLSTDAKL
jgi:hypothetical protein